MKRKVSISQFAIIKVVLASSQRKLRVVCCLLHVDHRLNITHRLQQVGYIKSMMLIQKQTNCLTLSQMQKKHNSKSKQCVCLCVCLYVDVCVGVCAHAQQYKLLAYQVQTRSQVLVILRYVSNDRQKLKIQIYSAYAVHFK